MFTEPKPNLLVDVFFKQTLFPRKQNLLIASTPSEAFGLLYIIIRWVSEHVAPELKLALQLNIIVSGIVNLNVGFKLLLFPRLPKFQLHERMLPEPEVTEKFIKSFTHAFLFARMMHCELDCPKNKIVVSSIITFKVDLIFY
jgi:hypothetical protein